MSNADGPPTAELLEQFLLGTLPPEEQKRVEDFVANDPTAAQTLLGLDRSADTLLTAVQASQTVPPAEPEVRDLIDTAKRLPVVNSGEKTTAMPGGPSGQSATDELTAWKGRLSPAERPDELGRLGGYRLLRVLGRGGMGVVFEAEDPRLGRRVALKVVRPSIAEDQTSHDRFLREARATAAVEHENIVAIHQVGEDRGVPYLAMPLLQGESLEDRLRREGRLPMDDVIRIGREIALGLAAAHEQGLIHRDIKPANIWLDARSGRVKILDFGLARGTEQAADHITQTGAIVGTPAYMAPEQAEGNTLDSRCDLFSLGCVLYRLATGELPFPGNSALQILSSLASRTPPRVSTLVPHFPPALSDLIARLMAKSPADRPATADDVCRLLEDIRNAPVSTPQLLPQRSFFRGGWIAVVVLLAALSGGGWWLFGGTILLIATHQGELTIHVDDPNIEVIVRQNDAEVHHKSTQRRFRVRPVNGEVEFLDPETGAVALTRTFQMKRAGERASVTITARQLAEARTSPKTEEIAAVPDVTKTPQPITPELPTTSAVSTPVAPGGGLRFDAATSRIEVPLYLAANAALTVEMDCTFGETHPFQEQHYLFAHTGNLEIKALANTLFLHSGSYPDQRAKISADNVIVPGRRLQITATISNSKMQLFINGQRGDWHKPAKPGYADGRRADMNIGRPGGTQLAFDGIIHRLRISEGERYHEDYTPEAEWSPGKDALVVYDFRKDDPQLKAIDLTGRGNHGKISSAKWVPHSEPPPAATVTASVGGLDFNPFDGRIEVPLQLPVNTPLTVEFDVTHGEIHPVAEQYYLFQHNKNLYYGIQGDRVVLNTGPWPDVRAHFYKVNVVEPGRRRQIAATVTDERLQLFVDGRRVEWQNTSRLETDATPVPVWVGRPDGAPGNRAFDGLLHRVRISTGEKYDKSYTPEAEWQPDATTLVLYDFRTVDPALGVTTAATVTTPLKIPPYPTSPDDLPAEFTPLFNGQGLTGWKAAVGDPKTRAAISPDELAQAQAKADQQLPSHWRVSDGILICDGHGHNLQTVKDYNDFELYLEWKIGAGGDSGVYLRGSPQVQIIDSAASKYEKDLGSGGLFNNRKHTKTPLVYADKPVGEWNAMFIRMVGEKVTVSLNGKLVVDDVVYENFVEPDQPIYPTGPIELQRYGQPVEFRNIRIRELTSVKPPPGTTGMVAQDLSGKGNHGKIVSSKWVKGTEPSTAVKPAPMDNTKAAVTAANPHWALQFDGDDYVKVRNVNWGRFENYTVEAFVTPERTSENVGFVVLQQRNITLALNRRETTGGWFLSYRHAMQELPEYVYGHAPAEMNRRVHLAGVANGKQSRLYVDGKLAGTTTAQRERAGIPGDNYDFGNHFFGTIDGIRLSKSARYEAPFTPPSRLEKDAETLALYDFAEGTGEFLLDSSGNGHHGQIVGAKWVPVAAP